MVLLEQLQMMSYSCTEVQNNGLECMNEWPNVLMSTWLFTGMFGCFILFDEKDLSTFCLALESGAWPNFCILTRKVYSV